MKISKTSIIRISLCLLVIVMLLGSTSCYNKEEDHKEASNTKATYEIFQKDDISIDSNKRYVYTVIINKELSKSDIEKIANEIVEKAKKENPFNAVQILFYDGKYAISGETMPTLGRYTYAPEGTISKSMDVKTGDYSKMKALNEIKDVNWKLRPSDNVQKIVSMYNELFKRESENNPNDIVKDTDIKIKAAEILGVKVEDIDKALEKLDNWIWQ